MSLTYQPFAEVPAVQDLSHELHMNVPDAERTLSALAGVGLLTFGISRSGWDKWVWMGLGAALVGRGASGRCPWYSHIQVDRRHPTAGVQGNRGIKVEHSVDIQCPPNVLYRFWRDLQQLPRVMSHLESVRVLGNNRSHWKVRALAGATLEWDAEIINDELDRMIAWQSLPDATVHNAGSVWFEPTRAGGTTRLKVVFEYDVPGGALGAGLAKILGSDPQKLLEKDLATFKDYAERELSPFHPAHAAG